MPRTRTPKVGVVIADSREAPLLVGELRAFMVGLTRALEVHGLVLQQWTLDDELLVTAARRRLTPKAAALATDTEPGVPEELG
jgi:hypothetical protein